MITILFVASAATVAALVAIAAGILAALPEIAPGDGSGVIEEIFVGCPRCKGSGVISSFEFGIRSEKVSHGRNAS